MHRQPPSKFGDTTERHVNADPRAGSRDQRANGTAIRVRLSELTTATSFASYAAMKHAVGPSDLSAEEIGKREENDEGAKFNEGSCPRGRRLGVRHWQCTSRRVVRNRQKTLNSKDASAEVT